MILLVRCQPRQLSGPVRPLQSLRLCCSLGRTVDAARLPSSEILALQLFCIVLIDFLVDALICSSSYLGPVLLIHGCSLVSISALPAVILHLCTVWTKGLSTVFRKLNSSWLNIPHAFVAETRRKRSRLPSSVSVLSLLYYCCALPSLPRQPCLSVCVRVRCFWKPLACLVCSSALFKNVNPSPLSTRVSAELDRLCVAFCFQSLWTSLSWQPLCSGGNSAEPPLAG